MNKNKFASGLWHHAFPSGYLVYCGSSKNEMKKMKHPKQSRKRRHLPDINEEYNKVMLSSLQRRERLVNACMRLDKKRKGKAFYIR